ncbi:Cytochrome P450, partial [Trinorchestia longiramus]
SLCVEGASMTRIWLTTFKPYVVLHKASPVETVLSGHKVLTKSKDYDFLMPWLGRGLLVSSGSKWFERRKMLTPAFHFKILEDFMGIFNEKSQILANKLVQHATGKEFDIFDMVTLCTLDTILETAMGLNMEVQRHSKTPYINAVQKMSAIMQERQKKFWLHPDFLFRLLGEGKEHARCLKILHDLSLKTIRERRQLYKNSAAGNQTSGPPVAGGKERLPFLDLLLKYSAEGENLTDEDIREEVDTFMFEGHDTTATAISMTLYLLGRHPEIQARVHDELDSVLEGDVGALTSDHLKQLKYLERCLKEAHRLYPSVPFIGRINHENIVLDGKDIVAGTNILVFIYLLHRDPEQFPEPERFDPDRFLPEQVSKRHPYAYVPFSAGPRNCIGQKFALMEEKVVLATILRRFRLRSVDDPQQMGVMGELILRPKRGIRVQMWPR